MFVPCGQSYKGSTIVNYNRRVVADSKIAYRYYDSEVIIYDGRAFLKLATDSSNLYIFSRFVCHLSLNIDLLAATTTL